MSQLINEYCLLHNKREQLCSWQKECVENDYHDMAISIFSQLRIINGQIEVLLISAGENQNEK